MPRVSSFGPSRPALLRISRPCGPGEECLPADARAGPLQRVELGQRPMRRSKSPSARSPPGPSTSRTKDSGARPSGDCDVGVWRTPPPAFDHGLIGGGAVLPALQDRHFLARAAGMYPPAERGIVERPIQLRVHQNGHVVIERAGGVANVDLAGVTARRERLAPAPGRALLIQRLVNRPPSLRRLGRLMRPPKQPA